MRRAGACFAAFLLLSLPTFAQFPIQGGTFGGRLARPPRDASTPPATGTGRIRGRIVALSTGQPLRRAAVRVVAPELGEPRATRTDEDGRYEISSLPPGRYTVTASKGSFVTLAYGQRRPNEPGTPIEVRNDQSVDRIDISLPPGAVITGHVLDESGEPVVNATVMPMQARFINGRRQLVPMGSMATTPDTGEFRLWGLMPGQYIVSVSQRDFQAMGGASSNDRFGYAPTYYPGTANGAEAQPITVRVGETVSGITMTLVPTRTASVSGVALNSQGRPAAGMVMAMPRTSGGMMVGVGMMNTAIRPDGTFRIAGLAPGEYTLRAMIPGNAGPLGGETLAATISISGEDVAGVTLQPVVPATLSGRIVLDQEGGQSIRPSAIRLFATPRDPELMVFGGTGPPQIREDYSFEARVPPGVIMLRVFGETGWTLKAVRYQGVDVTDAGLDVSGGQRVEGIEIELTMRAQEVAGTVTNAAGAQVKDYTVLVFAQNKELWQGQSRYFGTGRGDQDGRYKIRTLPPGDYFAIALEYTDQTRIGDPEYFESFIPEATAFSMREAQTLNLNLRLRPGQ
jgi:protocatechuate 3,4-dioxygenase beta subunit